MYKQGLPFTTQPKALAMKTPVTNVKCYKRDFRDNVGFKENRKFKQNPMCTPHTTSNELKLMQCYVYYCIPTCSITPFIYDFLTHIIILVIPPFSNNYMHMLFPINQVFIPCKQLSRKVICSNRSILFKTITTCFKSSYIAHISRSF